MTALISLTRRGSVRTLSPEQRAAEREQILEALRSTGGDIRAAARLLTDATTTIDACVRTLYRRLKEYELVKILAEIRSKSGHAGAEDFGRHRRKLKPAADGFRKGWHGAQTGDVAPIETLWDGINAE